MPTDGMKLHGRRKHGAKPGRDLVVYDDKVNIMPGRCLFIGDIDGHCLDAAKLQGPYNVVNLHKRKSAFRRAKLALFASSAKFFEGVMSGSDNKC